MIRHRSLLALAFWTLLLAAAAAAAPLTGTVTNGTANKPAGNSEVVLLSLMQGMQEEARTRTDASGKFSFEIKNPEAPHLVRVEHAGVNYHRMVPPGMSTADVTVFESATKLSGISVNVETAYETEAGQLKTVQFYTVRNASSPARTLAGDSTFELVLPEGAQIQAAQAQGPGGQPIQQSPRPASKANHYTFSYPIRPGETVFQIGYSLPYNGELAVSPTVLYPIEQFAIILPQSIRFEAKSQGLFNPSPHQAGINIQLAFSPSGKDLTYRISGNGTLPAADPAAAEAAAAGSDQRGPGGGLGKPIDAPDPLSRYRLPLLAILSGILALGALFMVSRRPAHATAGSSGATGITGADTRTESTSVPGSAAQSTDLLAALKEELFQLEVERQQGRISEAEYQQAKTALDHTLQRAVARQKTSS